MMYTLLKTETTIFIRANLPDFADIKFICQESESDGETLKFICIYDVFSDVLVVGKKLFYENEKECIGTMVDDFLMHIERKIDKVVQPTYLT